MSQLISLVLPVSFNFLKVPTSPLSFSLFRSQRKQYPQIVKLSCKVV